MRSKVGVSDGKTKLDPFVSRAPWDRPVQLYWRRNSSARDRPSRYRVPVVQEHTVLELDLNKFNWASVMSPFVEPVSHCSRSCVESDWK